MARHTGERLRQHRIPICLGPRLARKLDDLHYGLRIGKAHILRTLLERCRAEDFQKDAVSDATDV